MAKTALHRSFAGGARPSVLKARLAGLLRLALVAVLALGVTVTVQSPAQAEGIRELEYWLDDYRIREAWEYNRGEGVIVAVIDSGVDSSHPSLRDAVIGGKDFSGQGKPDGTGPVGTSPEHGTLVASLLAGRGDSATTGLIGAAPEAKILTASVGFGTSNNVDEQIAKAVIWAVDSGADIINLSLTRNHPDWPESWDAAFSYAFEHDVLVVAAAGNRASGTTMIGAPATLPGVVAVAGVDRNRVASFDSSTQGVLLALSAPSEELVGALPGGGYAMWSGTSGAAPIVSAVAALLRSEYPNESAEQIIARLTQSAIPAGEQIVYGKGLMDAAAALALPASSLRPDPSPAAQFEEWIRVYRPHIGDVPEYQVEIERPELAPITPEAQAEGFFGWLQRPDVMRQTVIPWLFMGGFGLLLVVTLSFAARDFLRKPKGE